MDKCKIVFVYCPGNGRHMARRQLHLIHRGGNVLIKCELCGIYWLQRSTRWEQIEQAMRKIDQRELSIKELPALKEAKKPSGMPRISRSE